MQEYNSEPTTAEKSNKYIIHINNFDGPLDLLWELIKKSKIDITEVSISGITEQYISYLNLMKRLNVSIASEFIWMASELLYYKSKALLPSEIMEDEYFVPVLPSELVQKLLEYKKFQKSSLQFKERFQDQADLFSRDNNLDPVSGQEEYIDVSLFELLNAFANVLESQVTIEHEEIIFDEILVSDRIEYIIELLREKDVIFFIDIFGKKTSRLEVVVSFLAILEMARLHTIKLYQHRTFGDIRLVRGQKL